MLIVISVTRRQDRHHRRHHGTATTIIIAIMENQNLYRHHSNSPTFAKPIKALRAGVVTRALLAFVWGERQAVE
eukprot:6213057-Pleurochrysis_carterae.AAC.3